MAYAFMQDVPINRELYARIVEGLGPEPPDGLVLHLALERPEGGLRYVDVWESLEHADRFAEQRLHPVVHTLLAERFGGSVPEEPERRPLEVLDVWRGEAALERPRVTSQV